MKASMARSYGREDDTRIF